MLSSGVGGGGEETRRVGGIVDNNISTTTTTNTTDIDKCSATITTTTTTTVKKPRNLSKTTTTTNSLLGSATTAAERAALLKAKGSGLAEGNVARRNISNNRKEDDVSYVGTTTVTTVPKYQQQQQVSKDSVATTSCITSRTTVEATTATATTTSSSSLLGLSPSALAKFNRIIDSTMPAADCYRRQQQQQHRTSEAVELHDIVTAYDSRYNRKKIDSTSSTTTNYDDYDDSNVESAIGVYDNDDADDAIYRDNQMKRNDVHYLLKQLNSFSDIEEIEIVDMKQIQRHRNESVEAADPGTSDAAAVTELAAASAQDTWSTAISVNMPTASNMIAYSPTSTSLVIISPSSQSHKALAFARAGDSRCSTQTSSAMRRYASLHQQQPAPAPSQLQQQQQHIVATLNLSGGNILADSNIDPHVQQQYLLQQFDDYMFESCHYLETNYFAATYRTGMIESNSHEFRPSTTTTTGSVSRTSGMAASSEDAGDLDQDVEVTSAAQSFELHEMELPSVICKAPPPPSPTRRFYATQARLTSSGVQTELTVSSLSTVATEHSITAKSSYESSHSVGISSASTSSSEQRRRTPFFRCCYTPIDRWRERRRTSVCSAEAKKAAKAAGGGKAEGHEAARSSTSHKHNVGAGRGGGNAV